MIWILPFLLMQNVGCGEGSDNVKDSVPVVKQATLSATGSPIPPAEMSVYSERVKGFMDSMFGNGTMNGSVLVAKHGQVIFEQYYGYANPRVKQDSITATTPFHLASTSKTFTGMGVLKLWQDGKLDINAPVSTYLMGFPYPAITVKLLLNHRSGLPKYDHYMGEMGWNRHNMVNNQDVLNFIISHAKTLRVNKADRSFSYSNTNFALLALIIEKVSGLAYHDFMQQTFFTPLGMKNTYVFTAADSASYLRSYYANGRPYKFDFLDMVYGDKNVYSTVEDLLKWDQALRSDSLFTPATLEAAYTGYSNEKPGIKNYGLGWRMYNLRNGKKMIYHNGWWHGNRAAFYRLPDEDVVIIGLCNNDRERIYGIKGAADIFGDYQQGGYEDEGDNEVVVHKRPAPTRKAVAKRTSRTTSKHTSTASKKKTSRSSATGKK
ncbi:MAG: serine hydrolase domain-containing protein [Chitinophagaceae bacterium]